MGLLREMFVCKVFSLGSGIRKGPVCNYYYFIIL